MVSACSARLTLTSSCFLLVQILAHLGGTNPLSCMKIKEKKIVLTSFCNHGIFPVAYIFISKHVVARVFYGDGMNSRVCWLAE